MLQLSGVITYDEFEECLRQAVVKTLPGVVSALCQTNSRYDVHVHVCICTVRYQIIRVWLLKTSSTRTCTVLDAKSSYVYVDVSSTVLCNLLCHCAVNRDGTHLSRAVVDFRWTS